MADPIVRTREDIEAEIDAARRRLAGNVENLISQVHPKAIVARIAILAAASRPPTSSVGSASAYPSRCASATVSSASAIAASGRPSHHCAQAATEPAKIPWSWPTPKVTVWKSPGSYSACEARRWRSAASPSPLRDHGLPGRA